DDGVDGLRIGVRRRERDGSSTQQDPPKDKANEAQSSNQPPTNCHSPHALCRPLWAPATPGHPRERSSLSPERPYKQRACTGLFLTCNSPTDPQFPRPLAYLPPKVSEGENATHDAVHCAAKCRMSL